MHFSPPLPPPHTLHNDFLLFSWDDCKAQVKLETMVMQNVFFWGGGAGGGFAGDILVYVKIVNWKACTLSTQPRPLGFSCLSSCCPHWNECANNLSFTASNEVPLSSSTLKHIAKRFQVYPLWGAFSKIIREFLIGEERNVLQWTE